jgi:hypothetical protein
LVIPGLDPAIHADRRLGMDHRVKPGGDEEGVIAAYSCWQNGTAELGSLRRVYFADKPERRTATIISLTQIVATPVSMGTQLAPPAALSNASSETVKASSSVCSREVSVARGRFFMAASLIGRWSP